MSAYPLEIPAGLFTDREGAQEQALGLIETILTESMNPKCGQYAAGDFMIRTE